MLLQIDTEVESEAGLRTAALLITSIADIRFGAAAPTAEVPVSPTARQYNKFEGDGVQAQNLPREPASTLETKVPLPPLDSNGSFETAAPSNVLPFVPPPPPLSEAPANKSTQLSSSSNSTLPTLTPPLPNDPLQYDASGLPWDARIHQKKQSKKKDGTWKLQKGIDAALVTAVVSELAAKRLPASIPQNVPPTASGRVPAPPVDVTTVRVNGQVVPPPPSDVPPPPPPLEASTVPHPPASNANVPPPPPPEFGSGSVAANVQPGASEFRALLDKITAASQAKQLTPQKVNEIVQQNGAPSLMALKNMPHLIEPVSQAVDLAIMGVV